MATGGQKTVGYSLAKVGTLTLETADKNPYYISIVVCQDKIVVVDIKTCKVNIHGLHDGKFLASSGRLESGPRDMCLMDAMRICVIHYGGLIEMMSIDSTDMSRVIKTTKTLRLQGVLLDGYDGVVRFKDNLLVTGEKQGMMYWCIVSLQDGHADKIHQICKGDGPSCRVTTKDNIIYISCCAGGKSPNNTGVYGYDVLNPSQCKYTYKHRRLQRPTSIVINEDGNIFVCNYRHPDPCIHQLTASCQLVAIFTQGIPLCLQAIFWDNGRLYGTCMGSRDITVFSHMYQGSHEASEVLVSNERKQPVTEETAIRIGQGNVPVDQMQSSVAIEIPSPRPVPEDSEDDKQGSVIPVEILRMDDKSLQLYKKALRDGKEKVYNLRVMIVGQFGVGKTTLTKRLLGKEVDLSERKSTEGIDVYKHCCKISLDTGEWIVQHGDSDELLRLHRLVKLLTDQTESTEDNGEQKDHTEATFQRETTPEDLHGSVHHNDSDTDTSSNRGVIDINDMSVSSELDVDQEDVTKNQPEGSSSVKSDQRLPSLEASSVMIQEGESHVTSRKDAVMEFLKLVNEKADKLEKSVVEHAGLGMWDFAGQYVFYTTHQTFLTCRAIYLLVTDLSRQITDHVEDDECFFDTEGVRPCQVQDMVEIWLNSIHCCAPSSAAGTLITSTDADIPVTPPVIIVGTHVDKIHKNKRKEVISNYFEQIRCILKDKPTLRHLVDFIAIDNTHVDPQLETLKKQIFQVASKQPYWGEEVPASWLPLEEALMKLKDSGVKMISRSVVENINENGSVRIEKSEELDLFLRFLHETGTIMYFSIEVLRENIVLDPNLLIDALKSLINAQPIQPECSAASGGLCISPTDSTVTQKWSDFKEKGILTLELVDAVWTKKSYPILHANRDHILLLMEQLNIIARPRSFTEIGEKVENYFLTPCMLRQKSPREVTSPGEDPRIVSTLDLSCEFTGKFLPPPIFHRLLAACVAHWPVAQNKETSKSLIFCGSCVFDLDLFHRLTLYYRNHVICARITRMVIDEVRTPDAKLCSRVRKFITLNLTKIISYLGQNLKYALQVQSPPSQGVPEARMFQMWFTDEEHDPDAPITPEHMNHARLCVALVTICGNAMREILLSNFPMPYKDIYQAILANKVTLTRRQGRPLLNSAQVQLVFPDPQGQKTGTVDQFDLSLLYTLIRNVSTVPAPSTGWGNDPQNQPRDSTLGASVERIRSYRNHISGHSADGKISQKEFEDYWNNIDMVLHDIESVIGRQVYSPELAKQRSQVISIYQAW